MDILIIKAVFSVSMFGMAMAAGIMPFKLGNLKNS